MLKFKTLMLNFPLLILVCLPAFVFQWGEISQFYWYALLFFFLVFSLWILIGSIILNLESYRFLNIIAATYYAAFFWTVYLGFIGDKSQLLEMIIGTAMIFSVFLIYDGGSKE